MNFYVDALFVAPPAIYHGDNVAMAKRVGSRNGHRWCHLLADDADCPELHEFATKIGMKRSWFQGDHYDLTPARRAAAVANGAIEVDRMAMFAVRMKQRAKAKAANGPT